MKEFLLKVTYTTILLDLGLCCNSMAIVEKIMIASV